MMKNLTIAIALLFGLLLGLVLDLPGAQAAPATIKDAAQKKKLLGKHMLSLQWLLFDKPKYGTATVTEKDGVLYLKGEQIAGGKDKDYLKVDGIITEVGPKSFKFKGKIICRVHYNNDGKECIRDGDMTFIITGKRKYWRLQEMKCPQCEVTDYVDLYFI